VNGRRLPEKAGFWKFFDKSEGQLGEEAIQKGYRPANDTGESFMELNRKLPHLLKGRTSQSCPATG
jgi:hypothetical protein